jgi:CRP/FNR family transcriptional regulator, cyclic AMP receptor protein
MEDSPPGPGYPRQTDEEMAALEKIGYMIHRPAGNALMMEGEYGDFALLIKKGHVKVTVGQPPRIVAIRGPGDIVRERLRHR